MAAEMIKVVCVAALGAALQAGCTVTFLREGTAGRHAAKLRPLTKKKSEDRFEVLEPVTLRRGEEAMVSEDGVAHGLKAGTFKLSEHPEEDEPLDDDGDETSGDGEGNADGSEDGGDGRSGGAEGADGQPNETLNV